MFKLVVSLLAMASVAPLGCPSLVGPGAGSIAVTATASASTAQAGATVNLTAAAPGDAGALTFAWIQTSGRGVAILSSNSAEAAFVAPSLPQAEVLAFMVTVRSSSGAAGTAEVRITVELDPNFEAFDYSNVPSGGASSGPSADAGADQVVVPGSSVTLDASASRGSALRYAWRQVGGPSVSLQGADDKTPTFVAPSFNADGDNFIRFEVAVTDRSNRTATDRVAVQIRDPNSRNTLVELNTTFGKITVELFDEDAPVSVENFLQYVDDGFFDNTIFHRVVAGFVVQGGGFNADLTPKETRDPIVNESTNGLKNERGTIAMARTNDPDSATSQFYFNLVDNDFLDRTDSNPGYAVFGRVVSGLQVVDSIGAVQTGEEAGFTDVPLSDVFLITARRVNVGGSTGGGSSGGGSTGGNDTGDDTPRTGEGASGDTRGVDTGG